MFCFVDQVAVKFVKKTESMEFINIVSEKIFLQNWTNSKIL